jgi:hypothetical protein
MITTLPRHSHCRCHYEPYYHDVKVKKLSWNEAVNKTMSKFSNYEKRKIFNSVRPKYPIRRYEELLNDS